MAERARRASLGDLAPSLRARLEADPRASFLLYGPPGVGKTHAAAALFRARLPGLAVQSPVFRNGQPIVVRYGEPLLRWDADAAWLHVPRWLFDLRALVAAGKPTAPRVEHACRASLVVLDDLGAEHATDWTAGTLYLVIAEREGNRAPTVVTTNLGLPGLHVWNPRLASRLGGFVRIALGGPDRRLTSRRDG